MPEQLNFLVPGWKARDTSRAAAAAIQPRASTLRDAVLGVFLSFGPKTADQVAAILNESILSIRPRVAELARIGEIEETIERRENASGHKAIVWRAKGA